jgi:hypothetical protein
MYGLETNEMHTRQETLFQNFEPQPLTLQMIMLDQETDLKRPQRHRLKHKAALQIDDFSLETKAFEGFADAQAHVASFISGLPQVAPRRAVGELSPDVQFVAY